MTRPRECYRILKNSLGTSAAFDSLCEMAHFQATLHEKRMAARTAGRINQTTNQYDLSTKDILGLMALIGWRINERAGKPGRGE